MSREIEGIMVETSGVVVDFGLGLRRRQLHVVQRVGRAGIAELFGGHGANLCNTGILPMRLGCFVGAP